MGSRRTAPTDLGICTVHGEVQVMKHKTGKKSAKGNPQYTYKCPTCHTDRARARYHGETLDVPSSIPYCSGFTYVQTVRINCARPYGHPPDVHVTVDGQMFPARTDRKED